MGKGKKKQPQQPNNLDRALSEIIAEGRKRKRDNRSQNVPATGSPAADHSVARGLPVAKRPTLQSVSMSHVERAFGRGGLAAVQVRGDPSITNWEATGGTTTVAAVDNLRSFIEVAHNVGERHMRLHDGAFPPMGMSYLVCPFDV
ncbi:hypothetical protein GGR52DRAFT_574162 [Hypoxylon sp. FL1284]|nr:hypothetical protein GGR52DRAFT_574162 [Hypoxylon sp. FL1284]